MRQSILRGALVGAAALFVAGCGGGGGHGFSVPSSPILILNNSLPSVVSGQVVNYALPISGGSGGPYLLEVISGELPPGIGTDANTVALTGQPLIDGTFNFTLKVTDLGSNPPTTAIEVYQWVIALGQLVFVTDAQLEPWVFARFGAVNLLLAGGTPPYSCDVIDDPLNANDEALPTGLGIPPGSCTVAGSPTGIKAVSPFIYKITIRARDHADQPFYPTPSVTQKEFTITVLVPPLIVVTTSVPDGKCGVAYTSKIDVVDGIAPFVHSVVGAATPPDGSVPSTVRLQGEPGAPGGGAKGTATSAYALETDTSATYVNRFPEGITLRDATGDLGGIPRRKGLFKDWHWYVQSSALPSTPSQNAAKFFTFSFTDAVPPSLALDTTVLPVGNTFVAPNNFMTSGEQGKFYSTQFKCTGGVPNDGKYDSPHETLAVSKPGEAVNSYDFSATTFAVAAPATYGMTFTPGGLFSGTPTQRFPWRNINLSVKDLQLPIPLAASHTSTGVCQFEVGPDFVVLTESLSGSSSTTLDKSYASPVQTLEMLEAAPSTPTVRAIAAGDFTTTHDTTTATYVRQTTGSFDGFKDVDFLTLTVNPTWWAYDNFNVCAKGARAGQHADPNRRFTNQDVGNDWFKNFLFGYNQAESLDGYDSAANLAVELPENPALSSSVVLGTYNNGGLLYAYTREPSVGTGEFGFLIVRKDSKIYVPYSETRTASRDGFGDGWNAKGTTTSQILFKPQITVSPNGRFAAAKIKASVTNWAETANTSKIVIFTLTGEKFFDGGTKTFKVIDTGADGTTNFGQFLYADSLTLTDNGLYYLTSNKGASQATGLEATWGPHWMWKYVLTSGGSSGALVTAPNDTFFTSTSNVSGTGISCSFHAWSQPGATTLPNFVNSFSTPARADGQGNAGMNPEFNVFNFANFSENGMAPHPFRVSANGRAISFVARGGNASAFTPSTVHQVRGLYVIYDEGAVRPATTTARRYRHAGRAGISYGENQWRMYGWYNGPYTQHEISDDGTRVAVVANASAATWQPTSGSSNDGFAREDMYLYTGTAGGSDPWATKVETSLTSGVWITHIWRFGLIAFTRDGNGLTFWGGCSIYSSTTADPFYLENMFLSGTMYTIVLSGTSVSTRNSILPNTDGGSSLGAVANFSSVGMTVNSFNGEQGPISPNGAFYSNDGTFFYVMSQSAIQNSTTKDTSGQLVGVNVSGGTINGRTNLSGYALNWDINNPAWHRGFGPANYYYYVSQKFWFGVGGATASLGRHSSAGGTNGLLYWTGSWQYGLGANAGTGDGSGSFSGGGPAHPTGWYDMGSFANEVFGVDASVGGQPFKLTNMAGTLTVQNTTPPPRTINYLIADRVGKRVAYVYSTGGSFSGDHYPQTESVGLVTGIVVSASGALTASNVITLEGAQGRAGDSLALDSSGAKVFYAFNTTGGGSDADMLIVEKTINSLGTGVSATRSIGGALGGSGGKARFAILNAGR